MRYENRTPPEGINTSVRSPLREFVRLSLFALVVLMAVGIFLNFSGSLLGGLLPFKAETWITQRVDQVMQEADQPSPFGESVRDSAGDTTDPSAAALTQYLLQLADRVEAALELPDPVSITLHYSDDDVFNAYATLGGHVYLFKGLLKYLPNENALAMLMAHEFAHVGQRHPARSVGGGLTLAVGSSVLLGAAAFENRFFNMTSALASTRFSRAMETEADIVALAAVNAMYGHVNGANDLFELFEDMRQGGGQEFLGSFFSTHPLDDQRIEKLDDEAAANNWMTEGAITPLPDAFQKWLGD
jgi:predicted Zn-dependent protease